MHIHHHLDSHGDAFIAFPKYTWVSMYLFIRIT